MMFRRIHHLLAALTLLFYTLPAAASPSPCNYTQKKDAYMAADIAVTGKVVGLTANGSDLRFQITNFIKGQTDSEIILYGNRPMGTEWSGFSLKENSEVFLLLRKMQHGVYGSIENYNSPCNVTYYVQNGTVALIDAYSTDGKEILVPVDEVSHYFTQSQ